MIITLSGKVSHNWAVKYSANVQSDFFGPRTKRNIIFWVFTGSRFDQTERQRHRFELQFSSN